MSGLVVPGLVISFLLVLSAFGLVLWKPLHRTGFLFSSCGIILAGIITDNVYAEQFSWGGTVCFASFCLLILANMLFRIWIVNRSIRKK